MAMARIEISPIDMMRHQQHLDRYRGFTGRHRSIRPENESVKDIVIEGYAILYNEPLINSGEINVIEAGSLSSSLQSAAPIFLQVNHDKERRIASTEDALAFVDDVVGLGFRVDLEETKNGSYIKQLVSSRQNAAVSVGLIIEESRVEKVGKHSVRFISRAKLNEISLVREGACADAFAGIVNSNYSEPVAAGRKGLVFKTNFALHKMQRFKSAMSERRDTLLSLASKLARIEREIPRPEEPLPNKSHLYDFYPDPHTHP